MRISAVVSNPHNFYKKHCEQKRQVPFQAHPDFDFLKSKYDVLASSFYRRGPFYGSPDSKFDDVFNVLKSLFTQDLQHPKKMLIVGVARSQEPFSYLTAIKSIIKEKKLSDVLDMNIVDLQSKPTKEELFKHSYYESRTVPSFFEPYFIKDYKPRVIYNTFPGYYRVNDEIYQFLENIYDSVKKSRWETRVQDAMQGYQSESFDVVSINNTLGYIRDKKFRIPVVEHVHRTLKPNGIYITDPHINNVKEAGLDECFEEIYEGIFRKKS